STSIRLRSSNPNCVCSLNAASFLGWGVCAGRQRYRSQVGELLLGGRAARRQEEIREVKVAPLSGPEPWRDRDIGQLGVAYALGQLAEVHDLEQAVEEPAFARRCRRLGWGPAR